MTTPVWVELQLSLLWVEMGQQIEQFQLFKIYIFVKVAIYETNLMHNEENVTQVHTIVINSSVSEFIDHELKTNVFEFSN